MGSQEFDQALYSGALERMEASKADRFNRAAQAQAPFAVGEDGVACGDRWGQPGDFHARPRPSQEVSGKVRGGGFGRREVGCCVLSCACAFAVHFAVVMYFAIPSGLDGVLGKHCRVWAGLDGIIHQLFAVLQLASAMA